MVLIDLSKVFDCLLHNLHLVKLESYVFSVDSLKLKQSYLVKEGKE